MSSSQATHYRSAAQVATDQLRAAGYSVRSATLLELSSTTLAAAEIRAFVTIGGEATDSVNRQAPLDKTLVYCMVSAPENLNLNPLRPTWGISTDISADKQFALIAEALPKVKKVGMLYHSKSPKSMALLEAAQSALPSNWQLAPIAIDQHTSVSQAINALFKKDIDVVWTIPDSALYNRSSMRSLLLMSIRNRVPVFGFSVTMVRSGALLGVSIIPGEQGKQAANLLVAQMKSPTQESISHSLLSPQFKIVINQAVSNQLRINIPSSVTQRAQLISADYAR